MKMDKAQESLDAAKQYFRDTCSEIYEEAKELHFSKEEHERDWYSTVREIANNHEAILFTYRSCVLILGSPYLNAEIEECNENDESSLALYHVCKYISEEYENFEWVA